MQGFKQIQNLAYCSECLAMHQVVSYQQGRPLYYCQMPLYTPQQVFKQAKKILIDSITTVSNQAQTSTTAFGSGTYLKKWSSDEFSTFASSNQQIKRNKVSLNKTDSQSSSLKGSCNSFAPISVKPSSGSHHTSMILNQDSTQQSHQNCVLKQRRCFGFQCGDYFSNQQYTNSEPQVRPSKQYIKLYSKY